MEDGGGAGGEARLRQQVSSSNCWVREAARWVPRRQGGQVFCGACHECMPALTSSQRGGCVGSQQGCCQAQHRLPPVQRWLLLAASGSSTHHRRRPPAAGSVCRGPERRPAAAQLRGGERGHRGSARAEVQACRALRQRGCALSWASLWSRGLAPDTATEYLTRCRARWRC